MDSDTESALMLRELFDFFKEIQYKGKLYHYASYEAAKSICNSDLLYMRRIDDLQDAYEGQLITEMVKQVAKKMHDDNQITSKLFRIIDEYKYNPQHFGHNSQFYIACFSSKQDSNLMWRSYADSMKGCCLIINTSELEKDTHIVHVFYDEEEKEKIIKRIITGLNGYEGRWPEEYQYPLDEAIGTLSLLFKQKYYSDEDEIRILCLGEQSIEEKNEPFPHIEYPLHSNGNIQVQLGPKCEKTEKEYKGDFSTLKKPIIKSEIKLRC